ncbi:MULTISPECIES: DDE-type integrase/transposase/recombinase [Xanthomonas]|uniref:DDE-type integrase/transposase/recombinase n=1 Tax=Xanthomonas TaxID=338 RepID=UPI001AD98082|nr:MULTISPECIES: DDE-type integrase/transposase/recombinase [unclassified Xanthomonas]MBO9873520.1 transposase family protein [Xanthomonas sp. D-93]WNH45301.1 DDE-type integrase/transposase/recombinase [Xanthomonas sp. A6251]
MGVGTIKVGQRFDLEGKRHQITRLLGDQRIEFEDAESARRKEMTQEQFLEQYKAGKIIFRPLIEIEADKRARARVMSNVLLASVPPKQRNLATLRLHFIVKLQGVPTTRAHLSPLIVEIWKELKPSTRELMPACPHASTVSRWMQQYRDANFNIVALLDQHALKGNRDRIPPQVQDLMEDCIRDGYLTPQRRSITSVLADINSLINDTNLQLIESEHLSYVSYEQLRKFITRLPAYEVYAARNGRRAADVKFRTSGKGVDTPEPLKRASMDHCRLDLFVVDAETGLPLGRPWLTVILDECTRMILGFSLSFDEPSALTVMRALRHAIMPKTELGDVTNPWPTWGAVRTLVVDNGLEFHGDSVKYAVGQFGTIIQTCPRRRPWYKGKIERFFRSIQTSLISLVPGRTFSSIFDRGDYDSSKNAVITLDTLNRVIHMWIVDIYHQTTHSVLGQSPIAKWESLIDKVDRSLPDSAEWVDASFGKPGRRVLGHEGILFDSLAYNSCEAGELRRRVGDRITVDIITNDENVGYLYAVCPETGSYIKIPAVDLDYANNLTRWQHTKCREYARALREETRSDVSFSDAKRRIIELIDNDMHVNNRKSRQAQARARSMSQKGRLGESATTASNPASITTVPAPSRANVASQSTTSKSFQAPPNRSFAATDTQDSEFLDFAVGTAVQYSR